MISKSTSVGAALNDMRTKLTRENGRVVVKRTQDATPYLDQNKREYNAAPSWRPFGSGRKDRPLRKVAEIPNIVVEQWMREGFNVFTAPAKELRRRLDALENRSLRTMPGRLGVRQRHI